jgi:hypothetical protein
MNIMGHFIVSISYPVKWAEVGINFRVARDSG